MTAETENAVSENAFFTPLNTYRSTQQFRTGTQSAKLAQNQQLETNFIDTRAGNQFLLNLYAFTTTSSTGARESETLEFNTPLLTNSYLPNNEGTAKFTPNLNLLALLKFLRKKENKSNERTTATYTVRLKVDLYSITKTLISSSVYNFPLTSHSWVSVSPSSIAITNTSVAFVKFTLVNPNTFPIFIDDWKIEEKGKVVLQENHYDPYGASLFGIEKTGNHEFLYQGKERMEELGLHWDDFEWRNYDITYFRTPTIDPHGERYVNWSPYSWVGCNPINTIDPDGRDWFLTINEGKDGSYNIKFSFTGRVLNETGEKMSEQDMQGYAKRMMDGLKKAFDAGSSGKATWSFDEENSYIKTEYDGELQDDEHAIRIRKDGNMPDKDFPNESGYAQGGSRAIYINQRILSPTIATGTENVFAKHYAKHGRTAEGQSSLERTFAHESGHTLYLLHAFNKETYNLMFQDKAKNTNLPETFASWPLDNEQMDQIKARWNACHLNQQQVYDPNFKPKPLPE